MKDLSVHMSGTQPRLQPAAIFSHLDIMHKWIQYTKFMPSAYNTHNSYCRSTSLRRLKVDSWQMLKFILLLPPIGHCCIPTTCILNSSNCSLALKSSISNAFLQQKFTNYVTNCYNYWLLIQFIWFLSLKYNAKMFVSISKKIWCYHSQV